MLLRATCGSGSRADPASSTQPCGAPEESRDAPRGTAKGSPAAGSPQAPQAQAGGCDLLLISITPTHPGRSPSAEAESQCSCLHPPSRHPTTVQGDRPQMRGCGRPFQPLRPAAGERLPSIPTGEAAAAPARPEELMAAGSPPPPSPPAALPPAAGPPRDSLPPADGNWEE